MPMSPQQRATIVALGGLIVSVGGCGLDTSSLTKLPKLPEIPSSLGAEEWASIPVGGTPADAYAILAHGALKCWFGAQGSLKATHAFHARVDPPSKGGTAEIVVAVRDPLQPAYGALRAYQVAITPSSSGSLVEARNVRFPHTQAADMTADVRRWLGGQQDCGVAVTSSTAAPTPAGNTAEPPPVGPKSRKP